MGRQRHRGAQCPQHASSSCHSVSLRNSSFDVHVQQSDYFPRECSPGIANQGNTSIAQVFISVTFFYSNATVQLQIGTNATRRKIIIDSTLQHWVFVGIRHVETKVCHVFDCTSSGIHSRLGAHDGAPDQESAKDAEYNAYSVLRYPALRGGRPFFNHIYFFRYIWQACQTSQTQGKLQPLVHLPLAPPFALHVDVYLEYCQGYIIAEAPRLDKHNRSYVHHPWTMQPSLPTHPPTHPCC